MLKLITRADPKWSYPVLSYKLAMSASEAHAGVKRAAAARLMDMPKKIAIKNNLRGCG